MAQPATINLSTIKRGDTYIADFYFTDTDGTTDISAITIDAQARKELDGTLWFDLKPEVVDAAKGHFRIHMTAEETRQITENPPGSFAGIYDIQFSWNGATEVYTSTIVAGAITISKDVTYPSSLVDNTPTEDTKEPTAQQTVNVFLSLDPGSPNYSDVVTVDELTPNQYAVAASMGLANINAIAEAGDAAAAAKKYRDETKVMHDNVVNLEKSADQSSKLATAQAAAAKKSADDAASVVTGGTATLTPEPGKIPLANSEGEIDYGWLPAGVKIPGEAEYNLMVEANMRAFRASGFLEMGLSRQKDQSVNEGITCYGNSSYWLNQFAIGYTVDGIGNSKTNFPVTVVAGVISRIFSQTDSNVNGLSRVTLPDAPDGTQIMDRTGDCRGSSKTAIDLKTEVDPKYGDVASTVEEANRRAFEGILKNGDFRLGSDSWGERLYDNATAAVSDGVYSITVKAGDSNAGQRISQSIQVKAGVSYLISAEVLADNASSSLRLQLYGYGANPKYSVRPNNIVPGKWTRIETTYRAVEDTTLEVQFQNNSTIDSTCSVREMSAVPDTEEVVVGRHDLAGYEFWLEEITPENPGIHRFGNIQSQAPDINGVPTTESNRADGYFAVYNGHQPQKGKEVNWFTATKEQKQKVLEDDGINLFFIKGKLCQQKVRQRTIPGLGNSPFTDPDSSAASTLDYNADTSGDLVSPRGMKDSTDDYTRTSPYFYGEQATQFKNVYGGVDGVFGAALFSGGQGGLDSDLSVDGKVYFLPVCTVQRLNQGAYHPTWNPNGTKGISTEADAQADHFWYDAEVKDRIHSKLSAFIYASKHPDSGVVGGTNKRGDQYFFHNAVYPGQVQDLRMSARYQDTSRLLEDSLVKAVSGEMRGKEKIPYLFMVTKGAADGRASGTGFYRSSTSSNQLVVYGFDSIGNHIVNDRGDIRVGDKVRVIAPSGEVLIATLSSVVDGNDTDANYQARIEGFIPSGTEFVKSTANSDTSGYYFEFYRELPVEFDDLPWVDVIGTPEHISATFPKGVVGQWIRTLPDGTRQDWYYNKKNRSADHFWIGTDDDGDSWTDQTSLVIDSTTNSYSHAAPATRVGLAFYKAFADFTSPSPSSELCGQIGGVVVTGNNAVSYGNRLAPSLAGVIGKMGSSSVVGELMYSIKGMTSKGGIDSNGKLVYSAALAPDHSPINSQATQNDSDAVKAMYSIAKVDNKLYLQLHGRQLKFDSGSSSDKWGDTVPSSDLKNAYGTIDVVNNYGTKTDLNGQSVMTFCHHSMFPVGWA